jgi:hypothetical protein
MICFERYAFTTMNSKPSAVQAPIDQGAHSSIQDPLIYKENNTDLSFEKVDSKWYLFVYNEFFSTTFHAYLESATSLESARAKASEWLLKEIIQLTREHAQMCNKTILWSNISDTESLTIPPNTVRLYLRRSIPNINTWWLEVYTYIQNKKHDSITKIINKTPNLEVTEDLKAVKEIALEWVSEQISQLICDYTQLSQQLSV